MTKVRGSERSDLDTGEAGDGRSDEPIYLAMGMATTVTPITTETAGATIFDRMEGNKNGKRRTRSEAPATAVDWRSRMDLTTQQQAHKIA